MKKLILTLSLALGLPAVSFAQGAAHQVVLRGRISAEIEKPARISYQVVEGVVPQDIVLVHGNMASNTWWEPFVGEIQKRHVANGMALPGRIVMIEWRGYGKSSAPQSLEELRPDVLGSDIVAVSRALKIEKAHLIGHSTGGLIGLYAIRQAPELFDRVILLDSVGPNGLAPESEKTFAPLFEMVGNARVTGNRAVISQVMAGTINKVDVNSAIFNRIVDDVMTAAPINIQGVPKNLFAVGRGEIPKVTKLENPALLIFGEKDQIAPAHEHGTALQAILPNSRLAIIPDTGHSLNVENPVLFTDLVIDFLGIDELKK